MVETGDLLEFRAVQTYLGQTMLNVYHYRVLDSFGLLPDYLDTLANLFCEQVLDVVRLVQVDAVQYVSVECKNLSNGIDIHSEPYDPTGGMGVVATENLMPSFVALGFLLRRESAATRNGYKRIGGLTEEAVVGNTWNGTGSLITNAENALASDVFAGIVSILEPVIVQRPITVPVGTTYVYSSIGSAKFRGVTSQNTRKVRLTV